MSFIYLRQTLTPSTNISVGVTFNELLATEVADAGSVEATVADDVSLTASEVADVGSFTGTIPLITITLDASETPDVGTIRGFSAYHGVVNGIVQLTLSSGLTPSTNILLSTPGTTSILVSPSEHADVGNFSGGTGTIIAGEIISSEIADVGSFAGSMTWHVVLAASETADYGAFVSDVISNIGLTASEVADVGLFAGIDQWTVSVAASETGDNGSFSVSAISNVGLTISETADIGTFSCDIIVPTTATLSVSETADHGSIAISVVTDIALSISETADHGSLSGTVEVSGNMTLTANEHGDVGNIDASVLVTHGARLVSLKSEVLHGGKPYASLVSLKQEIIATYNTPALTIVALKDEVLYHAPTVGSLVSLKQEILWSNSGTYIPPVPLPPAVAQNTFVPPTGGCIPVASSRFRKFWSTQPDSCPPEVGTCGFDCAKPGLALVLTYDPTWEMLNCGGGGGGVPGCPPPIVGASIATNDYVRGLVLNILGTNAAQAKTICGNIPGQRLGYWLDDISGIKSGSSVRYVPTKGYTVAQQVQFIQMQAQIDMQKLITYGVANTVSVVATYVGSNTVTLVITVQGVDEVTTVVNSTLAKIANAWVWNT